MFKLSLQSFNQSHPCVTKTYFHPGTMEELHSLDPRRQELLEARFMGGVGGSTGGSTCSTSAGTKVSMNEATSTSSICLYY